jgi:L-iditol 2-dehydrogenase
MAEYFVAEYKNIIPLPKNLPYQELVQAQQLGTVIYACQRLPNLIGKTVAIVGQGSAGIWFSFMTRRLGAARVIAIDLQEHRLRLSPLYGATDTVHAKDQNVVQLVQDKLAGDLPDVVIEASGETEAINLAVNLCKDYGFMLMFGVPHEPKLLFDYDEAFRRNLTLHACVYASREPGHSSTRAALSMIAKGEVDVKPLLTHHFPFAQVLDAYELQASKDKGALKIVIDMPNQ